LLEQTRQVSLIGEATVERNLAEWGIGGQHQSLRTLDSSSNQIHMGRASEGGFESTDKVRNAQIDPVREVLAQQRFAQVRVYVQSNTPRLPATEAAAAGPPIVGHRHVFGNLAASPGGLPKGIERTQDILFRIRLILDEHTVCGFDE
jgi:hypothetical protein